jgi:hypothetical protein
MQVMKVCPDTLIIGLMIGNAKVRIPSPPYMVPIRLKSAVFWLICMIWPFVCAHPCGQKLPANIMTWARNGSDWADAPDGLAHSAAAAPIAANMGDRFFIEAPP